MAAAPEMYAACKAAWDFFVGVLDVPRNISEPWACPSCHKPPYSCPTCHQRDRCVVWTLTTAIAKAEGRDV